MDKNKEKSKVSTKILAVKYFLQGFSFTVLVGEILILCNITMNTKEFYLIIIPAMILFLLKDF